MNIKDILTNTFGYTPNSIHDFTLPISSNEPDQTSYQDNEHKKEESKKIFDILSVNSDYINSKYNLSINSDIVTRNFILNARSKQYNAMLLYIDGMTDAKMLNDFVLNPLMLRNKNNLFEGDQNRIISEAVTNNIVVRKVKKFDLADYIQSCLLPQNNVKQLSLFKDVFHSVNSGNCVLFVDTLSVCFDIDIKGFKQRSISKPENEMVIKGSHEAFVENLRTNTSLLRRMTNSENLIIEKTTIGKITQTNCAICYIQNIVNNDLVNEVKYRLNNLSVDSLLSAGELEQLLTDTNFLVIPKILVTERPDNAVRHLLEGRVIVLVNGSAYALIMPAILVDFLTSPEDYNLKTLYSNFLKVIRLIAAFFTLLLPGLYIAATGFHREIIPSALMYTILAARESVPFPIIFEIAIMELSFEIIREAGLRVPSPIGPTLGIVGALVLGQAAVSAGIVSPILIIIVAITGISSFAIPDFTFSFHLRYYRFAFIILGFISGFLGIGVGIFIYISALADIKSFGVSYTAPYSPIIKNKNNPYFLSPIWRREYRNEFLASKRKKQQEDISMKWRY